MVGRMCVVLLLSIFCCGFEAYAQVLPVGYPCEAFGSSGFPSNDTRCPRTPPDCRGQADARYRTVNGTCNNLEVNTLWGSAGSPYVRFSPRRPLESSGYPPVFRQKPSLLPLPSARAVSAAVHGSGRGGVDATYPSLTTMVTQVGQFLDHDLTLTVEVNFCSPDCPEPAVLDCCDYVGMRQQPKACLPIAVPADDPFYGKLSPRQTCLDFKRSQPFPCGNYSLTDPNTREQFDVLTSFVDASHLYGSDNDVANKIRTFQDGLLRTGARNLLSLDPPKCPMTHSGDAPLPMFLAGDTRVNENPGLQVHHTLWMREHNRLAAHFKSLQPSSSDENLFQESRRFLVAEWQNLVYSELLPIVLGPSVARQFELGVNGPSLYRPDLSPNVFNEFATAAYRFGHTLIVGKVDMMRANLSKYELNLSDHFFNTSKVLNGEMDLLLRGMCMQSAELSNNVLNDQVHHFLFKTPGSKFGQDLAARNIQRGRDHEIASYDSYRQACGLEPLPASFSFEPPREITANLWSELGSVYRRPRDIELFPGGTSELPVEGGIVGPTFACIIGEQFKRLKLGDRYFFTHTNVSPKIRFCEADLAFIRRRKLNDLLCDNTEISVLPNNSYFGLSTTNELISCGLSNRLEPKFRCEVEITARDISDNDVKPVETSLDDDQNQVAVIAGGFDGWNVLGSVELYSPSGRCQHLIAPLPEPVYGPILAYVGHQLLACGGRSTSGFGGTRCWKYVRGDGLGSWVEDANLAMRENRWLGAGTRVEDKFYVTGGELSPKTSEFFDPVLQQWVEGPALSADHVRHCAAYGRDRMLLLGGVSEGTQVEEFDFAKLEWSQKPGLLAYREKHSCILLPDNSTVLIFGGTLFTNLYQIASGKSVFGPDTIISRSYASAVDLNGRILIIGGESKSTRVEVLDLATMQFKLADARTLVGRSQFAVVKVPARYFQHLPGGCQP